MQIISAQKAVSLIEDGWTIASAGFVGAGHPESLSRALEKRFLDTGTPRNLTLVYAAGQGDRDARGAARFAYEGLLKRVIGGHWLGTGPRMAKLVNENKIEAYNLPQGVIAHLYRAIAGHKPGVITKTGLHTFIDPRVDGARLNAAAQEAIVELIQLRGEDYLFYPSFPLNCSLIRASTADEDGNLSMQDEALTQDVLPLAQAARNSGGIVIAQVKRIVPKHSAPLPHVRVPGILVDYVVVAEDPLDHWMTYGEEHNPAYCGQHIEPAHDFKPEPLSLRKIIQRRAYQELERLAQGAPRLPVVNVGTGMPAGVGKIAREEGFSRFTMTIESGPIGGTPMESPSFGAALNPECIVSHADQFDFYDGGGIDVSFLGLAEVDGQGNVNVSKFGSKVAGVGGFVNITQSARHLVFMGALTAGGLEISAGDGTLRIVREGAVRKFVERVGHLSFNGPYTESLGITVRYVTERAVFEMRGGKLTLIEIAPGIDLERDVLARMDTRVAIAEPLRIMDARIFRDAPMSLTVTAQA
jgi:propionate CoA-transferase